MNDTPHIGTLNETSLHDGLKEWLSQPGDQFEVKIGRYVIDIVRGEKLIEIQTSNFTAIKRKLAHLLQSHPVRLVYPIPHEKWIVRQSEDGHKIGRRKSPKRGQFADAFSELVRIPHLLTHPQLSLHLLLTQQEVVWRDDGQGSWRRRYWSVYDHRLLAVVDECRLQKGVDYRTLLPASLPDPFTNRDLADALSCRIKLAQQMTYTLRKAGLLTLNGRSGRAHLHTLKP